MKPETVEPQPYIRKHIREEVPPIIKIYFNGTERTIDDIQMSELQHDPRETKPLPNVS